MRITRLLMCVFALLVIANASVMAQSWNSAKSEELTGVDLTVTGNEFTLVLYNLTGIAGDTTEGYDVIVWTLEPFNLPAPDTILEIPDGWVWSGKGWSAFEIASQPNKWYTPPALAPGGTFTFRYISDSTTPANVRPDSSDPGFLCHVAGVDSSKPGSDTVKWTAFAPPGYGTETWFDRSTTPVVPEPDSIIALMSGVMGTVGVAIRRRR